MPGKLSIIAATAVLLACAHAPAMAQGVKEVGSDAQCTVERKEDLSDNAYNARLLFLDTYLRYKIPSYSGFALKDGKSGIVLLWFKKPCNEVVGELAGSVL